MKIAVLAETGDFERRVAASPDSVKKLVGLGYSIAVEGGAGNGASIEDSEFEAAGASIADRAAVLGGADVVLTVQGVAAS